MLHIEGIFKEVDMIDIVSNEIEKGRRGFGMLDVLMAIGVLSVFYVGMNKIDVDKRQKISAINTAHQLENLSKVTTSYIKQTYLQLITAIPQNTVVEVPLITQPSWKGVGNVQSRTGLLSQNFNPSLPNGQEVHFLAKHIPAIGQVPEHIESMLITTGSPMNDKQVGIAINEMQGSGGGILRRPLLSKDANYITGGMGTWTETASSWAAAGIPVSYGHVAYRMDTISSPMSDYLDRYNYGNPESSRMHTHIDFNGNNAENVNNIDAQTIGNTRKDNVLFNTAISGNTNLRQTNVPNSVMFKNGINICDDNKAGCGISISDDGGFFDFNDGWTTLVTNNSNMGLNVQDTVKVAGKIGSGGYAPGQGDPSGWGGGLSTWDMITHATLAGAVDENGNVNVFVGGPKGSATRGSIQASETVEGGVIRPTFTGVDGDPCSKINSAFGDADPLQAVDGDIAKDAHGDTLTCVNGTWSYPGGKQFSHLDYSRCNAYSGFNDQDSSQFIEIAQAWGVDTASLNAYVGGTYQSYRNVYYCGKWKHHHNDPDLDHCDGNHCFCYNIQWGWFGSTKVFGGWIGMSDHGGKQISTQFIVPQGLNWHVDTNAGSCATAYH